MAPRRLGDAGSPMMTTTTTIAVPTSCAALCTKLAELAHASRMTSRRPEAARRSYRYSVFMHPPGRFRGCGLVESREQLVGVVIADLVGNSTGFSV
jgi:hypothetical protein